MLSSTTATVAVVCHLMSIAANGFVMGRSCSLLDHYRGKSINCVSSSRAFMMILRSTENNDAANDKHHKKGKAHQKLQRATSRETRMAILEELVNLSPSQEAELVGLRDKAALFEEQYDASDFSDAHHAFKRSHNDAFCALALYCNQRSDNPINLFFLDGPDAGTVTAVSRFFPLDQCFIANRHSSSCHALREWGLPLENVAHASAAEALTRNGGPFGHIDFGAYYFDACGGHAPVIVEMLTAAFHERAPQQTPIVVGFSLLGGNRNVMDKEVSIIQSLVVLARGLDLHVSHVLDDPRRYGVNPNLRKVEGSTMTTWFVLESVPLDRRSTSM